MNPRDMTTIALRTLSMWFLCSGSAAFLSRMFTWGPTADDVGAVTAALEAAGASLLVPVGGLLWTVSPTLARWSFPGEMVPAQHPPTKADLYAVASALVGLLLLSEAIPQMAYWIVVWRSAPESGFWSAARDAETSNTVVYWVHVRAQAGLVTAQFLMGALLLLGATRVKAGLAWVRRDLSGTLEAQSKDAGAEDHRNGG